MKVLNLGERSVLVQYVQLALNRAGYDIRKDGIWERIPAGHCGSF